MDLQDMRTVQDYKHWRSRNKQGRIPGYLKRGIQSLCEKHEPSKIAKLFGLKYKTLSKWLASKTAEKTNIEFATLVPLKPKSTPTNHSNKSCTPLSVTLELQNGLKLTLSNQTSDQLIELVLSLQERVSA